MRRSLFLTIGTMGLSVLSVFSAYAVTDTVVVTVNDNCSIAQDKSISDTIANGQYKTVGTNAITVTCNNSAGWNIKAVGSQSGTATAMTGTNGNIATGTATSGATSNWAFKATGSTGVTVASGYGSFTSIPSTATKVASGSSIYSGTLTTSYQVYASPTQAAGTYTGKVTYTIAGGTS